MAAALAQPPVEQREMHRLVRAHAHPVVDKFARKTGAEPADKVEGKINGDEFDMGERMQHRDPRPRRPALPPLGHVCGGQQLGPVRPRGPVGHVGVEPMLQQPPPPGPRRRARRLHLRGGIGGGEDREGDLPDGRDGDRLRHPSAPIASSTSRAWPATFTLGQTRTILPAASTRKVARAMPI